jgi:hypothetical protein
MKKPASATTQMQAKQNLFFIKNVLQNYESKVS